jgi:hypothetical protein
MARQFRALFRHFLDGSHLVAAGYFRPQAIAELLEAHLARRTDHGNRLWLLLNAEVWHRIHIEQAPVADLLEECREVLRTGPASEPAAIGPAA